MSTRYDRIYTKPPDYVKNGNINISEANVFLKGRMFGSWIDDTSRVNSFNEGDLIESPIYILESLLHDEINTETNLKITAVDTTNEASGIVDIVVENLQHWADDYYNDSLIINQTGETTHNVSDSILSTDTLTISVATDGSTTPSVNDIISIYDIRYKSKINMQAFDDLHTNYYSSWKFRRSIKEKQSGYDLINSLLFESFCTLSTDFSSGYKPQTLMKKTTADGTLSTPLYNGGSYLIDVNLSNVEDIYTKFIIDYSIRGKGDTTQQAIIDKNGSNLDGTWTTEIGYCSDAHTNYRIDNSLNYKVKWIEDSTTLGLFIRQLIKWDTYQKLQVTWTGDFGNHIKYEIGDQVLIDHSMIPASKRNSAFFIITGKTVNMARVPSVTLNLLEIR